MTWPQYFDGKVWENEIAQRFGIKGIPGNVPRRQRWKNRRVKSARQCAGGGRSKSSGWGVAKLRIFPAISGFPSSNCGDTKPFHESGKSN
jgi:hypothetical protein